MKNHQDVDVVICTKNQEKSLERLLRQIVLEIPFKNLIIVYGSSQDNTKEIALKYTQKIYWDEDRGLGAARNVGINLASSEIVAMIDSNIIPPNQ